MNILILRHAESIGNATGDYSKASSDALSSRGWEQAACLAESLSPWVFKKIFVSPLQRTMETILPYLETTRQQAELWPELTECCWHEQREPASDQWSSQAAEAVRPSFFYRNGKAVRPAVDESFGEGLCRVKIVVDRLESMVPEEEGDLLLVTHGHFIREFLNLVFALPRPGIFSQENCGMTLVTFDGTWGMRFCNRLIDVVRSSQSTSGHA